jgi:Xaa-Pro dipeptidase
MSNPPLFEPARLEGALEAAGVHALVLGSAPNVLYATRYRRGGRALAVVCSRSAAHPLLVLPSSDVDYVLEDLAAGVDVQAHGAFYRFHDDDAELDARETLVRRVALGAVEDVDGFALVAAHLRHAGLGKGRIAIDEPVLQRLAANLPDADVRSAPELIRQVRTVKTEEEVRRIGEAAAIAESAIEVTVRSFAVGVTQRELASVFGAAVAAAGARLRMDNVSFGRSTAFGNANMPDDHLEHGAVVRFDVGAVVDGYASDVSRCFAFGDPGDKAEHYYSALLAGQQAVLDRVRPGVAASALFDVAVRTVREEGIPRYERTNVGHGIGLFGDGYDPPLLASSDDTELEAGMVLCVETPYYELGFGGLQVEDMVVVTDSGYEPLTGLPRELQVVG